MQCAFYSTACITSVVKRLPGQTCDEREPLELSGPDGYISSQHLAGPCSWRLEAEPGQHISVTIYNFQHADEQIDQREHGYL